MGEEGVVVGEVEEGAEVGLGEAEAGEVGANEVGGGGTRARRSYGRRTGLARRRAGGGKGWRGGGMEEEGAREQ